MDGFWTLFFTALVPIMISLITAVFGYLTKASVMSVKSLEKRLAELEEQEKKCRKENEELRGKIAEFMGSAKINGPNN